MRSIADYIQTIPLHAREGRDWTPVDHVELVAWQAEVERLRRLETDINSKEQS